MRQRIPLHRLVVGPDHPPGLHLPGVLDLLDGSRIDDRAAEVAPLPGGLFEIRNGRHRYAAALIRGDDGLDCEVALP